MPIEMFEASRSRPLMIGLKDRSFSLAYLLRGSSDELAIWNFLHSNTPATYLGMWKSNVSVDPQGGDFWNGKVDYSIPEGKENTQQEYAPTDLLGLEFSWDTTGGTQHITQSRKTWSKTARKDMPAGWEPPDFKGAIGVSKDGVAGTDVLVPKNEFTITFRRERVTMEYYRGLERNTGKMNIRAWSTYAPGEVRFDGSTGRYVGNNRDDFSFMITYKFSGAENLVNIVIVPPDLNQQGQPIENTGLIVPGKRGWDHIWCTYDLEDTDASRVVPRATAAYVEEVLDSFDFFAVLGF